MDKKTIFGPMLREARKANGFSQRDISLKTGQNIRSIQRIENGEREPRLFLAIQLVIAAGSDPGVFFAELTASIGDSVTE